ncbi:hypothetical protein HNY73_015050 [Argiope bruennichi]|uniref:DUF7869 domain-containing protein n=1 Tax=Argiope bruennichi TaxID=94029 RepID=A0A8T0EWA9_ARGBR|nr:hypothetical protein HNY73_015050 [Argiope bruennichi]
MELEREKGNITPIIFTQHATLEDDLKISSSSDEVPSTETHAALSMVDNSIPSTFKQQKTGAPNYYISPIRSDESDIDDSDEDPNFRLVHKSKTPSKVVPPIASLTSSSTSSSSSSSSKSNSSSDTGSDSEQVEPSKCYGCWKIIPKRPRREKKSVEREYSSTTREFISSDKSLADIYRDYKRLRERDGLPVATSSTFNRIFNTAFNISFFVPKKDQCDLCERYKNSDEEGKRTLSQQYEQHLQEKTLARIEKENDKNRTDGTVTAVYDLQAVLQIPKGQISLFFYKSRINCLNLTVSDLRAKDVVCYFWDETEGKKGAVEIRSCILDYIKWQVVQNPNKEIDVIFYSDNCGGQQKNKFLLSAYAYAVNKLTVKSITHKFLICGHSQNEGDNVHSVIEKQIKRYVQSGPIYIPEQYKTLIGTAKKTGKPYKVVEITHDKFYDVKALQESWGTNFSIDEEKNKIKWHNIKVLKS